METGGRKAEVIRSNTHAYRAYATAAYLCVDVAVAVKIVKALYDFDPLQQDDLAFSTGDKLKIIVSDNASVTRLLSLPVAYF